jgi:hypothetical protein
MKWSEIAAREPALAAVAYERLIGPGVLWRTGSIRDADRVQPRAAGFHRGSRRRAVVRCELAKWVAVDLWQKGTE